jgi:hypothetical protein
MCGGTLVSLTLNRRVTSGVVLRVNTSEVTDEDCSGCEEVDEDVDAAVHRRVVTQVRSFVFTPETMYMLS